MTREIDVELCALGPGATPEPLAGPKDEPRTKHFKPTLKGHIQIARADHWVKNVFVLPGLVVALSMSRNGWSKLDVWNLLLGFAAISLITSSNYVLNEILDAPYDLKHPIKCKRPVPSGQVNIPLAYLQWIVSCWQVWR